MVVLSIRLERSSISVLLIFLAAEELTRRRC